jgi:outer membrane protein assembly factor BamE (lipoprotein component of BamABCDE complex)
VQPTKALTRPPQSELVVEVEVRKMSLQEVRCALVAGTVLAISSPVLCGCQQRQPVSLTQPDRGNELTHGAVQLKLRKGVTTQSDVLEAFGAPNITTIDGDGREVWTYRRHATVTATSGEDSYFNVVVFGTASGASSSSSSTQSTTLIIKFGPDRLVTDFRSMSTSF